MKIFLDTNVYVAEALLGATAQRMIQATVAASWRIYVSSYVAAETQRVIGEKLGYPRRFAFLTRLRILRRAVVVEPATSRHVVPGDSADDPILAAAVAAGVHYLVTNDKDLLQMDPYEGMRIITMHDYRRLLEEEGLF